MATWFSQSPLAANDSGSFRAFVSQSEAAFARFGWVNTNASGSVDWATIPPPNNTNQIRGYSVWRFSDAYQATAPVFIRADYGSSAVGATQCQVAFTVGRKTDGSGSVYDGVTNRIVGPVGFTSLASQSHAFSGDSARGWLAFGIGSAAPTVIGIERGRDIKGQPTPDQLHIWSLGASVSSNANMYSQWATGSLNTGVHVMSGANSLPLFFLDDGQSGVVTDSMTALDSAPAALLNWNTRNIGFPVGIIAVKRGMSDPTSDIQILAPYNQQFTYINLGNSFAANGSLQSGEFSLLLRWE